jgi:hypothetical protein
MGAVATRNAIRPRKVADAGSHRAAGASLIPSRGSAGDLDPSILTHLLHEGMSLRQIEHLLQHKAGLKTLAGTADVRELQRRGDAAAGLALDLFCYASRNRVRDPHRRGVSHRSRDAEARG